MFLKFKKNIFEFSWKKIIFEFSLKKITQNTINSSTISLKIYKNSP